MSRKRKKNKNPDGTNPSNGLYEHPTVVAARGRKDADIDGSVSDWQLFITHLTKHPVLLVGLVPLGVFLLVMADRNSRFMSTILVVGG